MQHKDIYNKGYQDGQDIFASVYRDTEPIGRGITGIYGIQDYKDELLWNFNDVEENRRQFSPFEFFAKEINESDNPEELWDTYEQGIADALNDELQQIRVPILEEIAADITEEILDESNPEVTIAGYTYDAGYVLRKTDPISFRQEVLNYVNAEGLEIV